MSLRCKFLNWTKSEHDRNNEKKSNKKKLEEKLMIKGELQTETIKTIGLCKVWRLLFLVNHDLVAFKIPNSLFLCYLAWNFGFAFPR